MKLIDDWKQAWRYLSVQAMALALALQSAWLSLPPTLLASVPDWAITTVTVVLLAAGLFGRMVRQRSPDGAP